MHEELREKVSRIQRGQVLAVWKARPGDGTVTATVSALRDFGMEPRELQACYADHWSEGEIVDFLNGIRLSDEVLILSDMVPGTPTADLILFNVEHCFVRHGGRAVVVNHA